MNKIIKLTFIALIFYSSNALGYVGPGLGLGFIASILGLLFSFFVLIFAFLWFPIKRLINKKKKLEKNKSNL